MKKKNIYILLPAVLIVWSILGYRIFSTINPTNTDQHELSITTQFKHQQFKEIEIFTINSNYRDPFLGGITKKENIKKTIRKVVNKTLEAFPEIIYKGVVTGKNNNNQVFLITINGQQYFFKKNNIHKDVKLLRGTSKKVLLKFQGQQQTFSIAK